MDGHRENNENKGRVAQRRPGRPLKHRALAFLLALVMILASSGIQAAGQTETDTSNEVQSTTTEQVVSLSDDDSPVETTTVETTTVESTEDATTSETPDPAEDAAGSEDTNSGIAVASLDDGIAVASEVGDYDITDLLTPDSWMKVFIDGEAYSLDYLNQHNIKVPVGARVDIQLEWDAIPGIQKGQKLVYQIPADLVSNVEEEETFPFESHNEFAGYMTLDSNGKFTVEIDEDFYDEWAAKQLTGSLELDFLTLEFYATLSDTRGHTPGNGDNEFVFKGETEGKPDSGVKFIIPFEYKNENGCVVVRKSSHFNTAGQTISYTVEVEAPSINTMTAENVVLTDAFASDCKDFLEKVNDSYYQNVKADLDGTDISDKFTKNGELAIGNMEPGQKVTVTYTVKVKNTYFSKNPNHIQIANTATATFNDDGVQTADDHVEVGGTAQIEKSRSEVQYDSDGAYILYTVAVTAYGGRVTDISVEDAFDETTRDCGAIKSISVESGYPTTGSVVAKGTDGLSWSGINLNADETATLKYRAYLNSDAWKQKNSNGTYKTFVTVKIHNNADLYVGREYSDTAYTDQSVTKIWLTKTGTKVDNNTISYTVEVNKGLMTNEVVTISDSISSGGTMNYDIKLYVYTDAAGTNQVSGSPFTINKSDLTDTSNNGWTLNLSTYKDGTLKGAYYYKLTYTVKPTGTIVANGAGIGLGGGEPFTVSTSVKAQTISGGKTLEKLDYVNYFSSWKAYVDNDVPAGAYYQDYVTQEDVNKGIWYFTEADLDTIKITSDGETIYSVAENINEGVTISKFGSEVTWSNSETGETGTGYRGFTVRFNRDFSGQVVVTYDMTVNKENLYIAYRDYLGKTTIDGEEYYLADLGKRGGGNSGIVVQNTGYWNLGNSLSQSYGVSFKHKGSKDVLKSGKYISSTSYKYLDGSLYTQKYDESELGYIVWYLYVGRNGDIVGDATVTDYIPEGLSVVDVYQVEDGTSDSTGLLFMNSSPYSTGNYSSASATYSTGTTKRDADGNTIYTAEKQSDGTTKVTVNLENMSGYRFADYVQNGDGTYTQTKISSFAGESNSLAKQIGLDTDSPMWDTHGRVTIAIVTKIDSDQDQLLVGLTDSNGNAALSYTNKVEVDSDTMVHTPGMNTAEFTLNVNLDSGQTKLSKAMATYSSGNYVTYNMTVNSPGIDLLSDSDTLTIIDVMEDERMSLATNKSGYFVVTNTKTGADITDQCSITLVEDYTGEGTKYKITVPDATPIKITYKVKLDAAVGETVTPTNKAYFEYKGTEMSEYAVESSNSITIARASGTSGSSYTPYFFVSKQDQLGNGVADVTFELYTVKMQDGKVVFDNNGLPELDEKVMDGTTNYLGMALFFGKTETETAAGSYIYCLVETSAPDGYVITNPRTYFEFYYHEDSGLDNVIGVELQESSALAESLTITNEYVPAELAVPFTKTINGEVKKTDTEFAFTLKQTGGGTVYSDFYCTTAATSFAGTITGSGSAKMNTVYFNKAGEYTFTLSENDPTETLISEGYTTKDTTTYTITVEVAKSEDGGYYVESVSYQNDRNETVDVPSFNNELTLQPGTLTLYASKQVSGRETSVKAGEFHFEVWYNGEVVSTGTTNDEGKIEFTPITFETKDVGSHTLLIKEVVPNANNKIVTKDLATGEEVTYDPVPGIEYTAKTIFATVQVDAGANATVVASVKKITNQNNNLFDEDGYPVFVNTYKPQGDFTLTGIKRIQYADGTDGLAVKAGEFNFTVTDQDTGTVVTTGTTKADGTIVFNPITYYSIDIGDHVYVITEDEGSEMFVEFDAAPVTITVTVADNGDGSLNATYVVSNGANEDGVPLFVNTCTLPIPTGIRFDVIPYAMVAVLAAGVGTMVVVRRRRRR